MSNRFDEFYLTICKEVGGIEGFIKSFFDFLLRKTDFFYECDPGDTMGFPPGYNKQLVLSILQHFQQEHYKKIPQKSPQEYKLKLQSYKAKKQKSQPVQTKDTKEQSKDIAKTANQKTSRPKQDPVKDQKQSTAKVQPIINTYNGGTNDKYSWSQQSKEVQVTIQIDNSINSKNIEVVIKNDCVCAKTKTGAIIIQGELYQRINSGESVWKIEKSAGKSFLVLTLEKAQDKIWSTVLKGDAEIDTTKVNNTKPLQEFDDETQGAIQKIMYEQRRKQMGLPTTEEEKQHEALKMAWNAEGSPFKGQPFDPSKLNLSGSDFHP